jgi:hypothetical protein
MKDSMKESRSDIEKREQRRAEKEMARYNEMYAAQEQPSASTSTSAAASLAAPALPDAEGRAAVKLGFAGGKKAKPGMFGGNRKPRLKPGLSVFQLEDDESGE